MLCYDIMELVGEQVIIIRKNQEYKNNYNKCINILNDIFRNGVLRDMYDIETEELDRDYDDWLGYIAEMGGPVSDTMCIPTWCESPDPFVRRFYTE